AAVNAALELSMDVEDQRDVVGDAWDAVQEFGTDQSDAVTAFEELLQAEEDLADAEALVANRAKLVQAVEDAKALVAQLEELEENIDTAFEALADLGYENVVLLEANETASGEGDI